MKLQNKVALVTGASRGIGRAIALKLARQGVTVVVHYAREPEAAREVVKTIRDAGGHALAVQADLGNLHDVRRLMVEVEVTVSSLDILVNNAGWAYFEPLENVTEETYDTIFNLNTKGVFFTMQEALKRMNWGGRVVLVSSGITRVNAANASVYAGSKAAIEAFAKCWAAELGPQQITVNVVSPGMTETDLLINSTPQEVLTATAKQTPLGRLGQPEDIADVVAFLCSEEARWLTAQNILANGGMG